MTAVTSETNGHGRAPDAIDSAMSLVSGDMEQFRSTLDEALLPQKEYLSDVEYDLYRRGKKIRPLLLLLSARAAAPEKPDEPLPPKAVKGAVSTEMLHVATLIHDDIIDRAALRRGLRSVNAARGTELAILIGDMQFVQAIRCFVDAIDTAKDMALVKLVLNTAFRICCGEIDELQTDPLRDTATLRGRYMRTIERKTAVLFGLACECGTALAGARTRVAHQMGFYGRRVGRAFQIMDDLFDIMSHDGDSGKTQGIDLARRRLSLPLIYAMDELGPDHLVSRIMRGAEFTPDELHRAIRAVRGSNAMSRVWRDARREVYAAIAYLEAVPPSVYRDALRDVAMYVVDRADTFNHSAQSLAAPA